MDPIKPSFRGITEPPCAVLGLPTAPPCAASRCNMAAPLEAAMAAGFCFSAAPVIANCLILSNTSSSFGGGVYQGTVQNSALIGNTNSNDGGAYNSKLINCTIAGNKGSGVLSVAATNCIIFLNSNPGGLGGTFTYCCLTSTSFRELETSMPTRQLLADCIHVASTSPLPGSGQ